MARESYTGLLLLLICVCGLLGTSHAALLGRKLRAAGDVKSETKIYLSPDGGVKPWSERLAAVQAINKDRNTKMLIELECKKNNDLECKELQDYKEDAAEEAGPPPKKVTAPCNENIFLSWFYGTVCDLPGTSAGSSAPGNLRDIKVTLNLGRRLLQRW